MNLLYEIVNYPPVFGVLTLVGCGLIYILLGAQYTRKGKS